MWLDSLLFKHRALRDVLSNLIPDRERSVHLVGREFNISSRFEIGLIRLAALLKLSPTAHELGSLISIIGLAPKGGSFVDVGANVGFYSVPMASIGDIAGFSVVALEPNSSTAARLRKNLERYRCAQVLEVAASSTAGTLEMGYLADSSATFQVSGNASRASIKHTSRVAAVRLDGMPWPKPWVLKVDVEGHEAEVLSGLQESIDNGTVTAIMFDGFADKTIPDRLRQQGFSLYDGRSLRRFNVGEAFNLLAIRTHRGRVACRVRIRVVSPNYTPKPLAIDHPRRWSPARERDGRAVGETLGTFMNSLIERHRFRLAARTFVPLHQ